jgi:hypothetical protein
MTSPTYWLDGASTGLLLADSLEELVGGIIPEYDALIGEEARFAARHEFLVEWATDLQAGFLKTGLERGDFSWAGLSDVEIQRLNSPQGVPEIHPGPWHGRAVLVRVGTAVIGGSGPSVVLRPMSARTTLIGLRKTEFLSSYGVLSAPARVEDPTRLPE